MLRVLTLWVVSENPTCMRAVGALKSLPKLIPNHIDFQIKDIEEPHDIPITHVPQLVFTIQNLVVYRMIGLENLTIEKVLNTLAMLDT